MFINTLYNFVLNPSFFRIFWLSCRAVLLGKQRYEVGLEKLLTAASEVGVMQNELVALQPALQQAAGDVKEIMAKVESETEDVAKVSVSLFKSSS